MVKRFFWFTLLSLAITAVVVWLRRRQDTTPAAPQFAPRVPLEPSYIPPTPAIPAVPALTERIEGTASDAMIERLLPSTADDIVDATPATVAENAPLISDMPTPMAEVAPEAMDVAATDTAEPIDAAGEQAIAEDDASGSITAEDDAELDGTVGYCMRCRTKRTMEDAHEEITETGRRSARGVCPVCGTTMFTFLKEDE